MLWSLFSTCKIMWCIRYISVAVIESPKQLTEETEELDLQSLRGDSLS